MSKLSHKLIAEPGKKVKLADFDPEFCAGIKSKQAATRLLQKNIARLAELQYLLYAEKKRALLLVFQAMDAGGKDGTIRHVMTGLNPQGCHVVPFKAPAGIETEHDYLWRIHRLAPAFGEIGIFNRSHYEDVLVVRVHRLVPKAVWSRRYDHINAFERMLTESGTTILKFFLHISQQEQKQRFEERVQDSSKNWKISQADFEDRKRWKDYMAAYEDAINLCSTPWAPWFIIPANKKWLRNLAVSEIIVGTLEGFKLRYPKPAMDLTGVKVE